jgi:hypothetical protein
MASPADGCDELPRAHSAAQAVDALWSGEYGACVCDAKLVPARTLREVHAAPRRDALPASRG